MKREILPGEKVRLSSDKGILHTRTGMVHSVVVCKLKEEKILC